MSANPVSLIVFLVLFVLRGAAWALFGTRWRTGDLSQLPEWGLGGRSFGTLITWFLLGGDLYTAYTFIAVPALMFGAGAAGFFAVPYAILMYPVLFMAFPRLWSVAQQARLCHRRRFRARPLRPSRPGAGGGADRPRRHHALYRAAAGGMQVVIAALGYCLTCPAGRYPGCR